MELLSSLVLLPSLCSPLKAELWTHAQTVKGSELADLKSSKQPSQLSLWSSGRQQYNSPICENGRNLSGIWVPSTANPVKKDLKSSS